MVLLLDRWLWLQLTAAQQIPERLGSAGVCRELVVPSQSLRLEICNVTLFCSVRCVFIGGDEQDRA